MSNQPVNIKKEFLNNKDFWTKFCPIYLQSKKYLLLIEELDFEYSTILQPIKEQRDALDHIVRACVDNNLDCDKELDKALGHISRAFYDVADILSIVLRERIAAYLSSFSYNEISTVWKDYPKKRAYLIHVNEEIAKLRLDKGSMKRDEIIKKYNEIIDELRSIHKDFIENIYPKLVK